MYTAVTVLRSFCFGTLNVKPSFDWKRRTQTRLSFIETFRCGFYWLEQTDRRKQGFFFPFFLKWQFSLWVVLTGTYGHNTQLSFSDRFRCGLYCPEQTDTNGAFWRDGCIDWNGQTQTGLSFFQRQISLWVLWLEQTDRLRKGFLSVTKTWWVLLTGTDKHNTQLSFSDNFRCGLYWLEQTDTNRAFLPWWLSVWVVLTGTDGHRKGFLSVTVFIVGFIDCNKRTTHSSLSVTGFAVGLIDWDRQTQHTAFFQWQFSLWVVLTETDRHRKGFFSVMKMLWVLLTGTDKHNTQLFFSDNFRCGFVLTGTERHKQGFLSVTGFIVGCNLYRLELTNTTRGFLCLVRSEGGL